MKKEKAVLVLGVGPEEGLGVALCKKFAFAGYEVFGCGRSKENMSSLSQIKLEKGSITGIAADVTDPEEVKKVFEELDKRGKGLASVIYNAGNNNAKPFLEKELHFFQDLQL